MTPAIGDNSAKAAIDRRNLFSYYHQKDRDLQARRKAISEEIKANRKNANANKFTSQKLDHYLKAFMAEDKDKVVDRHKSDNENLAWLGLIPDDPRGDLLSDRATNDQMVQAKGFHAGLTNLDRVSNYAAGSAEDKLWLESYDAGKSEYETEIPDILARISAAASKEEPASDEDPFPEAAE